MDDTRAHLTLLDWVCRPKMCLNSLGGRTNQCLAAISGSMTYLFLGSASAWPSPILTKMGNGETPFSLDVNQISWMVSIMFLGFLASPVPAGYLMYLFGPKNTLIYMSVIPFMSWLMIFFADLPVHLYVSRLAAGVWIGIFTTITPVYVGEISEPKLRGSFLSLNTLMMNLGSLLVYVVGPYVSYHMLAMACEFLTLLFFALFIWMPESPYYLLKQNQKEEALSGLLWLRKGESRKDITNEIERIELSVNKHKVLKGSIKEILFEAGNRKALITAVLYLLLKVVTGIGVLKSYGSVTLPEISLQVLDPDSCMIIIGFISVLSSVLTSAVLTVKWPRRYLLTVSCGGCAVSAIIVAIWFYLDRNTSVAVTAFSDVVFLSFAVLFFSWNIGIGFVGPAVKGELFSINVKALSSSIGSIAMALANFLVHKFYLIFAHGIGMYFNFLIIAFTSIFGIIFIWTYAPDTHNKSLEEIQNILKGESNSKYSTSKSGQQQFNINKLDDKQVSG